MKPGKPARPEVRDEIFERRKEIMKGTLDRSAIPEEAKDRGEAPVEEHRLSEADAKRVNEVGEYFGNPPLPAGAVVAVRVYRDKRLYCVGDVLVEVASRGVLP